MVDDGKRMVVVDFLLEEVEIAERRVGSVGNLQHCCFTGFSGRTLDGFSFISLDVFLIVETFKFVVLFFNYTKSLKGGCFFICQSCFTDVVLTLLDKSQQLNS